MLKRNLKTQIRCADLVVDLREYDHLVRGDCMDIIAGPGSTGITELMKLAHFAEIHHMNMEPHHSWGGTTSLHVLLAIKNADFYEKAVPEGYFLEVPYPGVYRNPVKVDKEGYVHAPTEPGLGSEIDFSEATKVAVSVVKA